MKKKNPEQTVDGYKVIVNNKKARFNYHFIETYEAGIVLTGAEIKSIRAGHITLNEAYVRVDQGELYLIGSHINEYSHNSSPNYNPTRSRKLLMHRTEIKKLNGQINEKGYTIVPTHLYLKKGRAKLGVALAKGCLLYTSPSPRDRG